MTHPLKTVESPLEIAMNGGRNYHGDENHPMAPTHFLVKNDDWVALIKSVETLRAIMGQDVSDTLDRLERAVYTFGTEIPEGKQNHEYSNALKFLRASIEDIKAGRICGVPDGWVMVPKEPTEAMKKALMHTPLGEDCLGPWRAAIAASTPGGANE